MATLDSDRLWNVPKASAELIELVEKKREHTNARVFFIDSLDGSDESLVVKILPRQRNLWLRRLITRLCYLLLVKRRQRPRPAPRGPYPHEVNRLLLLKSENVLVPDVIAIHDDWVVMSNAGSSIEEHYKKTNLEEQQNMMKKLAMDLANFHQKNCWHGGAQIRNIHQHIDGYCRFDFEEDLDRELPLPALQVVDLFMFISSLLILDNHEGVEAEINRVRVAVETYRSIYSHPAQSSIIRSSVLFLKRILWILKLFPKQGGKERYRVLVLIGLFSSF